MIVKTNIDEYGFVKDLVFGSSKHKIEVNSQGHIVCWSSESTWFAVAGMTDYTIYEGVDVPDDTKMWLFVDGSFVEYDPNPKEN